MADNEERGRRPAPREEREQREERSGQDVEHEAATEQTPLLLPPAGEGHEAVDQSRPQRQTSARRSLLASLQQTGRGSKRRWPSLLALLLLCILVILIMVFAFLAPSAIDQYAQQAVVFDATSLSIAGFTATGVQARIQGTFVMDAGRVRNKPARDLGRFFTYMARAAESGDTEVEVVLPEYGNVLLGTAHVPGITVDLRNGHRTHVDFLSDLEPGDVSGLGRIAHDWIDGRLGQLRVLGKATVPLKTGIVHLGKKVIQQELLLANDDIPSMPAFSIQKLNFREEELPPGHNGMVADVSVRVPNDYPVDFTVPPLAFHILVDNCVKTDPYIKLADAETHEIHVRPKEEVEINATGVVHHLPHLLTQACPGSHKSPLDVILGKYIHGEANTVYVQGADAPQLHTPQWVTDLMADITVPVPLPGKTFGHLIKNFSLADTHFSLPDPLAPPDAPEASPRISAKVRALVALPEEMNFNVSVSRVRADTDVFYKGGKLGKLDLHKWQPANSTRFAASEDDGPLLMVESLVRDAPLQITDDKVFTDVIQDLVFSGKNVVMHIKADVDVQIATALGELAVKKIPAQGSVPVQPISPGGGGGRHFGDAFKPEVFDLTVLETRPTGLTIGALLNVTNPTVYSASVPYVDINVLVNGTLLAHATARDLYVEPGENSYLPVTVTFDPRTLGGADGAAVSREMLSQYISGWNTTLTLQTHNGSIPTQPALGHALSRFAVDLRTPPLRVPATPGGGDHDDGPEGGHTGPHFIQDATLHLFSSTADFTLLSPLRREIIYITSVNATAYYKSDDVGRILYDLPFAVPPVDKNGHGFTTPRLPVDWSVGSVGYDAVRRALGGRLKVSAYAEVGVQLGEWNEHIWYRGKGIGASVRL